MQQDFEKRFLAQHNASPPNSVNSSPHTSPTKPGDRFIPMRLPTDEMQVRFNLLRNDDTDRPSQQISTGSGSGKKSSSGGNARNSTDKTSDEPQNDQRAHRALLRNELLKAQIDDFRLEPSPILMMGKKTPASNKRNSLSAPTSSNGDVQNQSPSGSLFRFRNLAHRSPAKRSLIFDEDKDNEAEDNYLGGSCMFPPSTSASAPGSFSAPVTPRTRSRERANKSFKIMGLGGADGLPVFPTASNSVVATYSASVSGYENSLNAFTMDARRSMDPVVSDTVALSALTSVTNQCSPYALSPLSQNSQRLLRSPRKPSRKIPRNPYKVLDAPELQDDFYLNLIDWSSQNVLAVGLGSCVYLWNAWNSNVSKLCDLGDEEDAVTSVEWSEKGDLVAVGTQKGNVGIWDVTNQCRTKNFSGHSYRVGCLAWNGDLICSGSRDRSIIQRDIRKEGVAERKLNAHKQEVCGMKWSPDRQYLASGGNDNQLLVWTLGNSNQPVQTYTDHVAAVKALAWSPHHHGLLVSGGGTADRSLRFWNTLTAQSMQSFDTGSQICNVAWSKHSNELVSTHGYSSQNQIIIWKYPSLKQVTRLHGHTYRVLYLAMSPDGESIVTGAGDETLRFWHVFSKLRTTKEIRSKLSLTTSIR